MEAIAQALSRPCLADTSVLANFVHSGQAALLQRLLAGPVHLTPTVLDGDEVFTATVQEPTCELLKPIYYAQFSEDASYRQRAQLIQTFAVAEEHLWKAALPSAAELRLASEFRSKSIRERIRRACPELTRAGRKRLELGAGEAEVVAVAVQRRWTLLLDDQAAVNLVRCLYPEVPNLRTCELLCYAAEGSYFSCAEAAHLFNHVIVDELHFYARKGRERLWLRCDPARCVWEGTL